MLISCPSCAAVYNVPEHLLAAEGQVLRCARCEHEWLVVPSAEPAQATAPVVSEHIPNEYHAEPPDLEPFESSPEPSPESSKVMPELTGRGQILQQRPPVEPVALAMAWVLTVFVMISIGWGAVRWRGEVMEAWPPSRRAYSVLGLH
jgi:predicted Zn finger-like uncharacterized protein